MPEHRIALTPGGWYVAVVRTGKEVSEPVVVHIRDRVGTVHVARLDPPQPIVAGCGARIDPEVSVIVEAPVTCKDGCR